MFDNQPFHPREFANYPHEFLAYPNPEDEIFDDLGRLVSVEDRIESREPFGVEPGPYAEYFPSDEEGAYRPEPEIMVIEVSMGTPQKTP